LIHRKGRPLTRRLASAAASSNLGSHWLALHPMARDVGLTALTTGALLIATPLIVALFGRILGAAALGEYLIVRRTGTWGYNCAELGLSIAVPRYVAMVPPSRVEERARYLTVALGACLLATACIALFVISAQRLFARLLFDDPQRIYLIAPLVLILTALVFHSLVYGYYRGCLDMVRANLLQLINMALVPVVAVLVLCSFKSVSLIVNVMAVGMIACTSVFTVSIIRQARRAGFSQIAACAGELVRFGFPRAAGGIARSGMLAAVAVFAAHYVSMTRVSYLLLGISLLMVMEAAISPLGVVMLSKATRMLSDHRKAEIQCALRYLILAVFELSLMAVVQLEIFADSAIRIWVGAPFLAATGVIRLVLLSAPFDLIYVAAASFIDAAAVTAYNTRNVLISVGVFFAGVGFSGLALPRDSMLQAIAVSMFASLAVLGALTLYVSKQLFALRFSWSDWVRPFAVSAALAAICLVVRWLSGFSAGWAAFLGTEALIMGLYIWSLRRVRPGWLGFSLPILFSGRSPSTFSNSPGARPASTCA
jgi:O-antigen/teichoic acid export membrane protein